MTLFKRLYLQGRVFRQICVLGAEMCSDAEQKLFAKSSRFLFI